MRIVSWNIRQGGGSGLRGGVVTTSLLGFDADLLVIPEFQLGSAGGTILRQLGQAGYHVSHPAAAAGCNTVLIASRAPIDSSGPLATNVPEQRHLWVVGSGGLCVVGVYMPTGRHKIPYWEAIIGAALQPSPPDLFIGDFNTGTNDLDKDPGGTNFVAPEFMERIVSAGFVDLWRNRHPEERAYTWLSPQKKNGFRLDHAFGSASLDRTVAVCRYDHALRQSGASDHSALILEIRPEEAVNEQKVVGCIYAFADPGCPGLVKIGKDMKWPLRLRQAQGHTPRGMIELARWTVIGDRTDLAEAERRALSLFEREPSCPGREWVRAIGSEVVEKIGALLGLPECATDVGKLRPFDDWRDCESPRQSLYPRRIWIGVENETNRLKLVHIPDTKRPQDLCPTFSRYGIRWIEAWGWPDETWRPSKTLSPNDRQLVDLWRHMVDSLGLGSGDGRVGWLRSDVDIAVVRSDLSSAGLVTNTDQK